MRLCRAFEANCRRELHTTQHNVHTYAHNTILYTHTHKYACTHMHSHTCTHTHALTHTHAHTHTHARTHTHTRIRTRTYTHTHTITCPSEAACTSPGDQSVARCTLDTVPHGRIPVGMSCYGHQQQSNLQLLECRYHEETFPGGQHSLGMQPVWCVCAYNVTITSLQTSPSTFPFLHILLHNSSLLPSQGRIERGGYPLVKRAWLSTCISLVNQ